MAVSSDKAILSLSDNKADIFKSTKAISWSQDNRAILCCAEKLAILTVVTSSNNTSECEEVKAVLEVTPDVSSLPSFSFASGLLRLSASALHINEDQRQRLVADPSLCEELIFPSAMLNTFKHAVFSPIPPTQSLQNLIAAVTYDYRVFIFAENINGWEMLMECSPLLKDRGISELKMSLPLTLEKDISLKNYTNLVHSMCCSEIEWSSVFNTGTDPTESYLLLFTGTRNGDVCMWAAKLPLEGRGGLSFKCADKYHSQVTALAWTSEGQDQGLLSVGYMNGSVRVLQVNVTFDHEFRVESNVLSADLLDDDLSIADLGWARLDEVSSVLIACKQYFLSVYLVCDNTVKFVRHIHNDVGMPLTSISTYGARGVVSSYDGSVFCFECHLERGELKLNLSKVNITCLPQSSDIQWLCLGVSMSPTAGLCLSAHRVHHNFKLANLRRRFINRQMVVMNNPFKLTKESVMEAFNTTSGNQLSPQDLMLSLRLHMQQISATGSSVDDVRQIYSSLVTRGDIKSLQIARDILKYFKQSAASTNSFHKELEWVNPSLEMISEKLVVTHVLSCLSQKLIDYNKNELLVTKSMLKWIATKQGRSTDVENKLNLDAVNRTCHHVEPPTCAICSSEFKVNTFLTVKCTKGHAIKLCSLTLLPCQDRSDRKCEACGHPAVGLSCVSDVRLINFKSMCVICGAYLRQNIA